MTSNLAIHSPIIRSWTRGLFVRHLMPVVQDSTTEMTEDKPEHCRENRLEGWIHDGKINREEGAVKRKSAPKSFKRKILPLSY